MRSNKVFPVFIVGELAADKFVASLKNGTLRKHILPNSAEEYSSRQEQIDLNRYRRFLCTSAYDEVQKKGVDSYAGEQL